MIIRKKIIASSLAAACAAGAFAPVYAAEDVQTIVVTAQSRKQTAQDVPIAMQVITMKDVDAIGATNLADMNGYIPGLTVGGGDETQPSFGLRGINPSDFGVATDSPVGVYVDGAYAGKSGGALMNFLDMQRVEVLKGPQGTLFGRNSAAGALSIVTNEPGADFDATGAVRFGDWNSTRIEGMVNAPINDTTAMRLAVISDKSDGWKENKFNGEDDLGGSDALGMRLSMKWAPDAQTKVIGTYEHSKIDQKARAAYGVAPANDLSPSGAAIPSVPASFSTFFDPSDSRLLNDAPSKETLDFDSVNLRFETPLAGMTFSSLTSWRQFKTENLGDYDGTANVATRLDTLNKEDTTVWQQEFKLSAKNERYDWVTGVSFYKSDAKQTSGVTLTTDSLDTLDYRTGALGFGGLLFGTILGAPSGTNWSESVQNTVDSKSMAAYGDVIWHLSSATNLTVGARWTKDEKEVSWFVPAATSSDGDQTAAFIAGFGETNLVFREAAIAAATKVKTDDSWTDVSPRLVLDHKYDPNTMVFASLSKGYQSGGYQVLQPLGQFDPEEMKNAEVGIKMNFPAQKASLNASLFKYKFTDIQSLELVSGSNPLPQYEVSSGDQKAWGLDIDGSIRLNTNVRFFSAAEYIEQKWDKKTDSNYGDISGDLTGLPKLTAMAGVVVNWAMLGGHVEWNFQGTYSSKNPNCPNNPVADDYSCRNGDFDTGKSQEKFDTRIGWMNSDRRYGVALIVNNVFDKQYVSPPGGTAKDIGAYYSDVTDPRFVAVEFKAAL